MINSGKASARASLGLARVTASVSMYKRSRTMISKAHELDPHDPDVQKYWMNTLKLPERIKYLEDYLSYETNDDVETRARMQRSLDYMKARSREPKRKCRLVSKTISTETNLVRVLRDAITCVVWSCRRGKRRKIQTLVGYWSRRNFDRSALG